jgi:ABC-type thiamine transport system ATPase subunit
MSLKLSIGILHIPITQADIHEPIGQGEPGGGTLYSLGKDAEVPPSRILLITVPRLKERLHQHGGTLSGGEQQMLTLGRVIMRNPELLLLDEPSMRQSLLFTRRY